MNELWQDVRYALRSLRKAPGFAVAAVLTLALGIGANSAVFSVLNGVVLRPLPYRAPGQLVALSSRFPTLGFDRFWISPPEFMELEEWTRSYSDMGAWRTGQVSVGAGERPLRVIGAIATADFFTTLGIAPQIGRIYTAEEDRPGTEPVAVLSHELWTRTLGADLAAVGQAVLVNGVSTRVLGVMPPGFDIEDAGVEIWRPMQLDRANRQNRGSHYLNVVGRLHPDVSIEQAATELNQLVAQWGERVPNTHVPAPDAPPGDANAPLPHPLFLTGLQDSLVGSVRPALVLLLGAVGFVLLIACANVGNLLLVRSESRNQEIAVRAAIGAGRGRLLRQFLTEGVVLAVVGGVLGLGLGWAGVRVLLATSPESVPRADEITVDPAVLLFTFVVAVLAGLCFGLAPLLHLEPQRLTQSLREGGQRSTAGAAKQRVRRLLVVAELALAVVLVVGAGLMLRSFEKLQQVDPGFDPAGLVAYQLFLPAAQYPDPGTQVTFLDRLLDGMRTLPGVSAAAVVNGLPPKREVDANDTQFENVAPPPDGPPQNVDFWQFVGPGYIEAMQIRLVQGRTFDAPDANPDAPVVLINERLAELFYPGQDPLGKRIRPCCGDENNPWHTVIGVVGDVKHAGLAAPPGTQLYFNVQQSGAVQGFVPRSLYVVVRTTGNARSLLSAIPGEVRRLDPTIAIGNLQGMDEVLDTSVAQPRFLTLLLGIFAAVALVLATIGTYGVIAYSVAERRQEIGIRMALGAQPGGVVGMILGQALRVAAVGLAIGVGSAFALTKLLHRLLFNVSATDPATFITAPLVLAVVAAAACVVPSLRAARVDPVMVLKH